MPPADVARQPRCRHDTRQGTGELLVDALHRLTGTPYDVLAAMPCEDVHALALALSSARRVAAMERRLTDEYPPDPAPAPRYNRASYILACTLLALTLLSLAAVCGLFGGILL